MSLTSHLDDKNSPIRNFLRSRFPNSKGFLKDARKRVREADIIRQTTEVRWGTVGTALDYRIRYYFGVTPHRKLIAYKGARVLTDAQPLPSAVQLDFDWTGDMSEPINIYDRQTGKNVCMYFPQRSVGVSNGNVGETLPSVALLSEALELGARVASSEVPSPAGKPMPLKGEYVDFFRSLSRILKSSPPPGARLAMPKEDALNRHCVVLALMEEVFRAHRIDGILEAGEFSDAKALTAIAEAHWVDDLRELSWRFYDDFNHLLRLTNVLNPTFDGSMDVGGADADLIVNGTLIEIKTTVSRKIEVDWLWQLLGYVLLDYTDRYRITGIGLYMARQGILLKWSLEEAMRGLCSGEPLSIKKLRTQFKNLAQKIRPLPDPSPTGLPR